MTTNKKYFVFGVLALILISAIVLGINNARKDKKTPTDNFVKIDGLQAQSYAAGKNPVLVAEDKVYGSPDAKLKIFVYEDYSNIYSANLADTLEKIRQENSDLSIIVRPYISSNVLSKTAALAMQCSNDEWVKMRALLFAQVKNNQFNPDNFSANAKQIGLNEAEFNSCLTNPEKFRTIEETLAEAKTYSVDGSPTIFVGDEMILGARPYDNYTDSNGDKVEGLKQVIERNLGK